DSADTIRQLLDHAADPLARGVWGSTALHVAAVNSDADPRTDQLLIEAGLIVDARNRFDATPLMEAVLMGNPEMIEALLDAGANPRFPPDYRSLHGTNVMELARQNERLYRDGKVMHLVYWRLNDLQYD